jgi:hypothetical protein
MYNDSNSRRGSKMKIVRLNLSDEEYIDIYDKALGKGFGSVPEYLRYLMFNERSESNCDFDELLDQFEKIVLLKNEGDEFKVKDCFDQNVWKEIDLVDRRTLGRMIIHKVNKGGWLPIVPTRKDSGNAQWYKKLI